MREFNVTGICVPHMHYMVNISEKIEKIFKLVEGTKYFTINRGRQYGKTTTIGRLKKRLPADYICASISFQGSSEKMFSDEEDFCRGLLYLKSKNMDCGYLLTFDFRKKRDPASHEAKWVNFDGKRIFDVMVRVGE